MLFKDLIGGFRPNIQGPAAIKNSQGEPAKLDGWLSDDEAKQRFLKAPTIIQTTVEAERAKHLTCASDAKPFRVDVVRDVRDNLTYLDINCEGCGKYRKLRVSERTDSIDVMMDSMTGVPLAPTSRPTAKERLEELERERERLWALKAEMRRADEETRRQIERERQRQEAEILKRSLTQSPPSINPAVWSRRVESRQFLTSVDRFDYDATDIEDRILRAQPLRGKSQPKKPVHVDKLGLERAQPADDDEV